MEQQQNNNIDNKPMEQPQIKKTKGRPKKTEHTEQAPKETKQPKAKPKEQTTKQENPETKQPKAKPKAKPKEQTTKQENPETIKKAETKEEKPKAKPKRIKLDSEQQEIFNAELKVRQFKEAERQYLEALKGLNKYTPEKKTRAGKRNNE